VGILPAILCGIGNLPMFHGLEAHATVRPSPQRCCASEMAATQSH
jgi:hypothetical protein